ncbi:hypothetical protein K2173_014337 [Erythroxylum novogranatense]|uniref:Uncharacterized protein n=1 Tax=Erythroxylum novogranatense TaxID=1862640 RepID=A0AAV8S648_9ROSI|nr:hypothetical protein K2173_014337 [Erythroxylum novogranatense]
MARTNKYTSINFNHIYEKNLGNSSTLNPPKSQPSSSSSSSSSFYSSVSPSSYQNNPYNKNNIASVKGHGRMLVLTRPNPKPVSVGSTAPQASPSPKISSTQSHPQASPSPKISSTQSQKEPVETTAVVSPKPDKFLPPHLRPGFSGKEERPGPEVLRQPQGSGSKGRHEENGRPKSGGGYERMRRTGDSYLGFIHRPRSSGNRPNSSG